MTALAMVLHVCYPGPLRPELDARLLAAVERAAQIVRANVVAVDAGFSLVAGGGGLRSVSYRVSPPFTRSGVRALRRSLARLPDMPPTWILRSWTGSA